MAGEQLSLIAPEVDEPVTSVLGRWRPEATGSMLASLAELVITKVQGELVVQKIR